MLACTRYISPLSRHTPAWDTKNHVMCTFQRLPLNVDGQNSMLGRFFHASLDLKRCSTSQQSYRPSSLSHSLFVLHCVQTMVALDMDGKVRKPSFELDSEQVRYEHRFAPFNSVVTPPPVHYIQFKVVLFTVSCLYMYISNMESTSK